MFIECVLPGCEPGPGASSTSKKIASVSRLNASPFVVIVVAVLIKLVQTKDGYGQTRRDPSGMISSFTPGRLPVAAGTSSPTHSLTRAIQVAFARRDLDVVQKFNGEIFLPPFSSHPLASTWSSSINTQHNHYVKCTCAAAAALVMCIMQRIAFTEVGSKKLKKKITSISMNDATR